MANQSEKINAFTQSILNDAKAECDSIFAEIEKEREESLSTAEDEILAETYQYIKSEVSRIKTMAGRAVSKKVLENKRILFSKRDEIAAKVLDEVKKRLDAFTQSDDYLPYLIKLLKSATAQFKQDDTIIYLKPDDLRFAEELKKSAGRENIEYRGSDLIQVGGLIAQCPSRQLRADETLDAGLTEVQSHFSELLGLGIASQEFTTSSI